MGMFEYPKIHMERTGRWLRFVCRKKRKSVRTVKEMLGLTTVQSVYDWFHGRTLPSLDNMCALGKLLGMPVELLLIGEYGLPLQWFGRMEAGPRALFHYHTLYREKVSNKTKHRVEEDNLYDCLCAV